MLRFPSSSSSARPPTASCCSGSQRITSSSQSTRSARTSPRLQSPIGDFLPQAYLLVKDNPAHARFLSEILYFRGDIVRLGKLHALLDAHRDIHEAQLEAKQIAGVIAFLQGDNDNAVARFEEALEAIQRSTEESRYFIGGYAGVFFLLALARSGSAGLGRATQLARLAGEIYDASWLSPILNLRDAFDFASGQDNERLASKWGKAFPADLLTIAWSELWTEAVEPPDMRRFDRIMFDAENAEANGNTWLAAELFEIASRLAQAPHDQSPREKAASLRAKISPGYQTAADTIHIREPWEKTLANIERIASQMRPTGKANKKTAAEGRLVWVLDFDEAFSTEWELNLFQQKLGKSGKWNKARSASPRRMFENPPPFLSDQDRLAISKLVNERSYDFYANSDAAIIQLIDHPLLFLDESLEQPIELRRRDTQLVMQPASKGEIYLRLDPAPAVERKVTLTRDTPSRIFLTETTPSVTRLQELFGADGISLPEGAKDRLLEAVTKLAGEIEIQSGIGGTQFAKATNLDADATPQLHLIPHGEGLSGELLVQPIPGFGRHYLPGHGVETVFAKNESDEDAPVQT